MSTSNNNDENENENEKSHTYTNAIGEDKKQHRAIHLGIIGTRNYNNYSQLCQYLDTLYPHDGDVTIGTVVSGGASGADSLAERYAKDRGYDIIVHKAEWSKYYNKGRAAYIRNKKVVDSSDELVAFWDGISPGTKMTINIAAKEKKSIHVFRYDKA